MFFSRGVFASEDTAEKKITINLTCIVIKFNSCALYIKKERKSIDFGTWVKGGVINFSVFAFGVSFSSMVSHSASSARKQITQVPGTKTFTWGNVSGGLC